MSALKAFSQNGWHGVVSPEFALPGDITRWTESLLPDAMLRYNSRVIARVTDDASGAQYYVKMLFGASENMHALPQAIKWRLRSSRALHVAAISAEMHDCGIDCAEVVLAARRRAWQPFGWPTDIIVTRQAEGVSFRNIVKNGDRDEIECAVRIVAEKVAALHRAGFVHGDCQPGNLFVQLDEHSVAFIDNDRTARSNCLMRSRQEARNLIQLGFGLLRMKNFTMDNWQSLMTQYAVARGCAHDVLNNCVMPRLNKRLKLGL